MRQRHSVFLNQRQKLFQVKARHHHYCRAYVQSHVEHDYQTVDVKQREDAQQSVAGSKVFKPIHLPHVRDQIVVSEHHSFRQTRGTAGIRQGHQVFTWIDLDLRHVAVAFHQRIKSRGAFSFTKDVQLFNPCLVRSLACLRKKKRRGNQVLCA